MNTPIANATLQKFLTVAADIAHQTDAFDPRAVDQLDLFADGEGQACEAFMEERERLRSERKWAIDRVNSLSSEVAQSNRVLLTVASFARELQSRMNSIGIRWVADENGEPEITIDTELLAAALTRAG